ncbi:MAG TPA: hypothetical protein VGA72_07445 [Anaerolineales bacterium]
MSRFFAQLLLSVMIGVGAAVGFRSDVRGEVNKTSRQAKVSLNERANIALDSAGDVKTQVNTAVSVSARANTNAKASIKGNAKVDAKAKGNLDVQVTTGGDLLNNVIPDIPLDGSLDSSLNTNSQTNIGADAPGLVLDLKNKTQSTLDLGLDLLK